MRCFLRFFFLLIPFLFHGGLRADENSLPLKSLIESLASENSGGDIESGLLIQDLQTGQVVYSKNADLLLNPASNTKILTTLAALSLLGPDFTFKTQLLATQGENGETLSTLTLKGFGDPFFTTERLEAMVKQLKDRGVARVEKVLVDGSYFDGEDFPGQMDGSQRDAAFNCSVGAVSLDHNLLEIMVTPGEKAGRPATVEVKPSLPSFPMEENVRTQRKKGRILVKNDGLTDDDLKVSVKGTITAYSGPQNFKVSIHRPLKLAGLRLIQALKNQGIETPSEAQISFAPVKSKVWIESQSPPLTQILQEINKQSDNFMAEQLTKALGAQYRGAPGTSAKGVKVILKKLKEMGVETEGLSLENGSGLSKNNRLRAKTLAQVLKAAYDDPKIRTHFMNSLSVLGVDGTLKGKFRHSDMAGRFLGKTGTLRGVSSLSGYAFSKNPERTRPYIYSFIVNGNGKNFWKEKQFAQVVLEVLLND